MCCGSQGQHSGWHRSPHSSGHHHVGFCACGAPFRMGSCFPTKEQETAWLERYLEGLQKEATTVEERIAQMREE